jgi:dTDP-4-dehydrorhamnose reductase
MAGRIVVLGAAGQLGFDLMRTFGHEATGLSRPDLDITRPDDVRALFARIQPRLVINAAAIVRAEWCEQHADECFRVNTLGAYHVARAAAEVGAPVVFFSTDYVFDGSAEGEDEEARTRPLNIYGASKASAEALIAIANPRHWIIRCGWLFGFRASRKGHDFPRLMLRRSHEQAEVRVVNDQYGSPTYTRDLAGKVREIIERAAPYGIYHVTNQGTCTWFIFARRIFEIRGIQTPLTPISTAESGTTIHRPRYSVLKNKKLQESGIPLLRSWEAALEEYFAELDAGGVPA